MSDRNRAPAIQALNEALNRKREQHGFVNDIVLAQHLGISDKTVSLMRNGHLTKTQRAIVAVLTGDQSILMVQP